MVAIRTSYENRKNWREFFNAAKAGVDTLNNCIATHGMPPNYVANSGKTLIDMLKESESIDRQSYSLSINRLAEFGGTYSSTLGYIAALTTVSTFIFAFASPLGSVFIENIQTSTKAQYVFNFEHYIDSFSKINFKEKIDFGKAIEKTLAQIFGKGNAKASIAILFAGIYFIKLYNDNKEELYLYSITDRIYQTVHSYLFSHEKQVKQLILAA